MEEPQLFIMDCSPSDAFEERNFNNNYQYISAAFHQEANEIASDHHEDLEYELEKREKEVFLCSELGLFLVQEIDHLMTQQKTLVNDHTRVLLDLQSYETSKKSFLDLADFDTASELNDTLSTLSCLSPDSELSSELHLLKNRFHNTNSAPALDHLDKLANLQTQIFSLGSELTSDTNSGLQKNWLKRIDELHGKHGTSLRRSGSFDSVTEVQSLPESTLTSFSHVTKNLQFDLDKLQRAHDRITRLEVQLDSTRAKYRNLMTEYSRKLKDISQSLGTCVERARPYFDAVMKARKSQIETQQAAIQYKRAVNLHKAGRDMVKVAEERLASSADKFDTTWQEMLNQATLKVNEASKEKDRIHATHMKAAKNFKLGEEEKNALQVTLQRNIVKAKPYFEVQQNFQAKLEATTKRLNILEVKLLEARQAYSDALSSIRQSGDGEGSSAALDSLAERGMGVGAENPYLDGSVLPKPMQDILRLEAANNKKEKQDEAKSTEQTAESIVKASRFRYNPYDLMYLKETGSENGSTSGSVCDDYIQDF